jgi:hypothetical protein
LTKYKTDSPSDSPTLTISSQFLHTFSISVSYNEIRKVKTTPDCKQQAQSHKQGDITMKKWMLLAVAVVLVTIAVLAPAVFAQGPADGYGPGYGRGAMVSDGQFGPGFVDEDGNGICDNFVDEDGDGVCDHAGEGGHGPGFVDEDGDGVCDHAGTGRQAGRGGRMMGRWAQ